MSLALEYCSTSMRLGQCKLILALSCSSANDMHVQLMDVLQGEVEVTPSDLPQEAKSSCIQQHASCFHVQQFDSADQQAMASSQKRVLSKSPSSTRCCAPHRLADVLCKGSRRSA